MVIDEELLRQARESAGRMADAERQAEVAKADYHHAIRRLHVAGGSMREIAQALEISHQRVHQVVEAAGGSRNWRVSAKSPAMMACSFCGRGRDEVGKLVAGPGVYICDSCGANASQVLASSRPVVAEGLLFDLVSKGKTACSFCGRRAGKKNAVVVAADGAARVCGQCLEFLHDVIAEESR